MSETSASAASLSAAPRDVLDRLTSVGWSRGLAAILLALAASFLLFGYFVVYYRNADMDFMVIYSALAMNAGHPQHFMDHTAYLTILMVKSWFGLLHQLGLLDAWTLPAIPKDAAGFDLAMTHAVRAGRVLAFLVATGSVVIFAGLSRSIFRDWRIALLATLAFALSGLGVWSLVLGSLVSVVLNSIGINLLHPFLHWPKFSFKGLGRLFGFGGYVALSRVMLYLYLQADMIVGGRMLGKEQIGFYSVGMHLASMPMQRVSAILNEVAFPAFARIQENRARVAHHVLQAIRLAGLCAFPVFWGMGAVAPELVGVLLGAKWEPAILPLQLLAAVMPLRMIGQLMPPTLQGVGKARLNAQNQFVACVTMIVAFLIGVQYGIVGLAVAWVVGFPLTFIANVRTWFPALDIPASKIFGAIVRPALAAAGMFVTVEGARMLGTGPGPLGLATMIAVGAVTYGLLSLAMNRNGLREARHLLLRRS